MRLLPICTDEDDVALVDGTVIRAGVRSLLVASPQTRSRSVILRVSTDVLRRLCKIKQRWSIRSLLTCGGSDVATNSGFGLTVAHESLVVGVELELLGQLLLRHVNSLVVYLALVRASSKV